MQIFLDTADTDVIRKHFETGLVDGITTNPTLIMKSGRNPEDVYQEIADIGVKDISMEVVGDADQMTAEGLRLAEKFGDVATIKLPMTDDGLRVCKLLSTTGPPPPGAAPAHTPSCSRGSRSPAGATRRCPASRRRTPAWAAGRCSCTCPRTAWCPSTGTFRS